MYTLELDANLLNLIYRTFNSETIGFSGRDARDVARLLQLVEEAAGESAEDRREDDTEREAEPVRNDDRPTYYLGDL